MKSECLKRRRPIPSWIPHARTRESHPWNQIFLERLRQVTTMARGPPLCFYTSVHEPVEWSCHFFFLSPATRQQIAVVPFSRSYTISLYSTIRAARTSSCIVPHSQFLTHSSCDIKIMRINKSNISSKRNTD